MMLEAIQVVKTSIKGIQSHKLRSALTTLGIIIGVAAFVSMLAMGEGAKQRVIREIQALGTNVIFVEPTHAGAGDADANQMLRYADYEQLNRELKLTKDIAPSISLNVNVARKDKRIATVVEGTTPSQRFIRNYVVNRGRFLTEQDINAWRRVAVLGSNIANQLFASEDPIGQDILIEGQRFIVIGVMKYKPQTLYVNSNNKVLIPVATAMKFVTGNQRLDKIHFKIAENSNISEAATEVKNRLLAYHGGQFNFSVNTQEQLISTLTETSRTMKMLLGSIAAISLVVGGIGIMNIMLVSVTERTREIGLRIAIGATQNDILLQFVMEAVILALIGGIIGVIIGIGTGNAIGMFFTMILPGNEIWEAIITPGSIVGVMMFVVIIGIAAGVFPAYTASRLDPAEALRYE